MNSLGYTYLPCAILSDTWDQHWRISQFPALFLNQIASVFCICFVDSSLITLLTVSLSKQLDLFQNISLRNISFDSVILHADSPRSWAWMISIISRIPHHSLERVTMIIFLRNTKQINALELSALDTLFMSQPLSHNSTKLCISICGDVDMDAARTLIKDTLPELVREGRLEL